MLNTLKRKIALVAVSAVGMSGLALMSAPAANAVVTGLTSMTNNPTRNSTLAGSGLEAFSSETNTAYVDYADNKVAVSLIGTSDSTLASNIVAGETATLRAIVISAPTPAAIDSTSAIVAGDTLVAVGYLKSAGAASSFTLATKGDSVTGSTLKLADDANGLTKQGMHSKAFRTAGSYVVDVWVDFTGFSATNTSGNGNSIGEPVLRTTITIGGAPTAIALSSTSGTAAGTSGGFVGVTLKDVNGVPTLINGAANESITIRTTTTALSTETLTMRRGTVLAFNNGLTTGDSVTVQSRVPSWGGFGTPSLSGLTLPTGQALVAVGSNESITASTGSYNYRVEHSGAMASTFGFNLSHSPLAADLTYTFSTVAGAEVTKVKVTNASGVHTESSTTKGTAIATGSTDNNQVYTAPGSIETATLVSYKVNPAVTTVGLQLTGTAASVVNVTVTGSTVAGVTNGTTQITLDATGVGTINFTATTASGTYQVSVPESASGTANLTTDLVFLYETAGIAAEVMGNNGITTDLLSKTVTSTVVKTGATTVIKTTVKDQYGNALPYYSVKGVLGAGSRNVAAVFPTAYTGADGTATTTLVDVSTSTTNLVDVLTIDVAAPGTSVTTTLINGGTNVLTITYSATGAYTSLAVTGGTTAALTKTVPVETADVHAASIVTLVPSLKDSAGLAVSGVALTWTATDGVYFREVAATRPTTGDVKTLTLGSTTSVFAYGTKPGVATVTITGGGVTTTATFTVAAVIANTARSISAVASSGRVTATVKDGWGNPVPGVTVSFAADNKGIFGSGVSSTSAITDAAGLASALVQSADATGADVAVIASITGAQQADLVDSPVTGFAAGVATVTVTAKPTAGAASTDTAITAVKTDVATANAAVKALATQVTVLQASVATLIDSLTTQIASLMKSVSALTKAVAKLQAKK
jgi:adhesin/invasin